ncbi:MAG: DUF4440 domain-containing protein [Candidatus Mcinerneyibacterium aminivorans]|uniref:DUF4440 domain-containing protein n=1 Tax=Candidatus Mcinerneyibacterium aminivorans TaxID=2703815 RepID=A0A5D0M9F4_9BACT|nr:MAG: DUF4440 domain-containing protein [Candidatus Mcinerneyibacterium aminivorans]
MKEKEELKNKILSLENKLLIPEIRSSGKQLKRLLSEDFVEYCSSGRIVDKKQVISSLTRGKTNIKMEIKDFKIKILEKNIVQSRFSLIKYKNNNEEYSLRSSIWKNIDGRWQMVFHQGTIVNWQSRL